MKTIILGAGITGLTAGVKTGNEIYEAESEAGGICRTYSEKGYMFEVGGGHWIFGANNKVRKFINKHSQCEGYKKNAGVLFDKIISGSIQDYVSRTNTSTIGTMKHWLHGRFGNDLCQMFFYPFNLKYTAGLYDRIIQDDPDKSPTRNAKEYNDLFLYPEASLAHLIYKLEKKTKVHYNKEVNRIDTENKVVFFDDGDSTTYDKIISTLPLNHMLKFTGYEDFVLPHTSTMVINIGAKKGDNLPEEQWLYVPYSKSGFYRIGFYSNVDHKFAPRDSVSIYAEKAYEGYIEDKDIHVYSSVPMLLDELYKHNFIKDIEVMHAEWIDVSYTWLFKESQRQKYIDYLMSKDITSIGRYGKWKFQGIADSIEDGLKL